MTEKNRRETGARKLEPHPEIKRQSFVDTGDRGDDPERPYGLTQSMDERGSRTRQDDGKQPKGTAAKNPPPDADRKGR